MRTQPYTPESLTTSLTLFICVVNIFYINIFGNSWKSLYLCNNKKGKISQTDDDRFRQLNTNNMNTNNMNTNNIITTTDMEQEQRNSTGTPTRKVASLIVISYAKGRQQANVWLNDGTRLVIIINNDGNYIPYELIKVAVQAAARDAGTDDAEAFTARFDEVIEQGGEPRPTAITVTK